MSHKHALIIGGTGMLKDVSVWLTDIGYTVSVIGRSESKHRDLKNSATHRERIHSLKVDYDDLPALVASVRRAIETHGPISAVVSWTPNYAALERVSNVISEGNNEWKLFQVKGSRRYFEDDALCLPDECEHRSIYLGFILEGDQSRWLTNKEIAEGVIKSVASDKKESIVGTLHPYEKRPGY